MAARRVRIPAWLLWFAAALCGPLPGGAPARAGCGDHDRPTFPVEALATVAGLGDLPRGPATAPPPADAPRPCAGPSCSRPPAAPATAHAPDRRPPDPGLDAPRATPPRPLAGRSAVEPPAADYAGPTAEPLDRPPRP